MARGVACKLRIGLKNYCRIERRVFMVDVVEVQVMLAVGCQACHLARCECVCVFAGVSLARPPKTGRNRCQALVQRLVEKTVG